MQMQNFEKHVWAEIDLDALRANFRTVKQRAGSLPLCAVVKAYSYGHGAVQCARVIAQEGASWLAVSCLAEALQGQARLRADLLRAVMAVKPGAPSGGTGTGACGDLIRIEAEGSVFYVTGKDQRVRGDAGVYDAAAESVTLTGDVIAVQGQNVLRGSKMVFNTKTGEGRMMGAQSGRNSGARPRGVFYPSKKQADSAK